MRPVTRSLHSCSARPGSWRSCRSSSAPGRSACSPTATSTRCTRGRGANCTPSSTSRWAAWSPRSCGSASRGPARAVTCCRRPAWPARSWGPPAWVARSSRSRRCRPARSPTPTSSAARSLTRTPGRRSTGSSPSPRPASAPCSTLRASARATCCWWRPVSRTRRRSCWVSYGSTWPGRRGSSIPRRTYSPGSWTSPCWSGMRPSNGMCRCTTRSPRRATRTSAGSTPSRRRCAPRPTTWC